MGNTGCCQLSSQKVNIKSSRQEYQISANLMDSIRQLKAKIAEKNRININSIILAYNGRELNDNQKLSDLGFAAHDHVSMAVSRDDNRSLEILIKNINYTEKVEMNSTSRVRQLKQLIHKKINFPVASQRLIFNGIVLQNEDQIGRYGLEENSTVHLATVLSN